MDREQFLDFVKEILISHGYILEEDNIYKRELNIQQPGHQMIINGQRISSPGQIIKVEYRFKLEGEGYIEDNEGNKQEFEMINISVTENNDTRYDFTESFYYNESNRFLDFFTKIHQ